MFRFASEQEFLNAFRTRDRKFVEAPKGTRFPLTVLDSLSWTDESGERVFLLFKADADKHATGIAFRRDHSTGGGVGMCDWCHFQGSSAQVGLLTTDVTGRRKIGAYLCLDLQCVQRAEEDANRRGRSARDAMKQVLDRMSRFARQGLRISDLNRNQPQPQP